MNKTLRFPENAEKIRFFALFSNVFLHFLTRIHATLGFSEKGKTAVCTCIFLLFSCISFMFGYRCVPKIAFRGNGKWKQSWKCIEVQFHNMADNFGWHFCLTYFSDILVWQFVWQFCLTFLCDICWLTFFSGMFIWYFCLTICLTFYLTFLSDIVVWHFSTDM